MIDGDMIATILTLNISGDYTRQSYTAHANLSIQAIWITSQLGQELAVGL